VRPECARPSFKSASLNSCQADLPELASLDSHLELELEPRPITDGAASSTRCMPGNRYEQAPWMNVDDHMQGFDMRHMARDSCHVNGQNMTIACANDTDVSASPYIEYLHETKSTERRTRDALPGKFPQSKLHYIRPNAMS